MNYDLSKIGNSSRLIIIIDLDCSNIDICELLKECNKLLEDYRKKQEMLLYHLLKEIQKKVIEEDWIIEQLGVL